MKEIPLPDGLNAIVDDEDFAILSGFSWKLNKDGYAVRYGRHPTAPRTMMIYMHRVIAGMQVGDGKYVDHRNHEKLDNRRENLRICTMGENNANKRLHGRNTSGFKGVTWDKFARKWEALIYWKRKGIYLGVFESKNEAAHAYNKAAITLHGEFATLNPIGEPEMVAKKERA
jgi:hypothetical protein